MCRHQASLDLCALEPVYSRPFFWRQTGPPEMAFALCAGLLLVEFDGKQGQRVKEKYPASLLPEQEQLAASLAMPDNADASGFGTQRYCYRDVSGWGFVRFSLSSCDGDKMRGMNARSLVILSPLDCFGLFSKILDAIAETNATLEVAYSQLAAAPSPTSFGLCGRLFSYTFPRGAVGLFHDVLLGSDESILPHLWTIWANSSSGVCVVCPSSAQRACAVVLEIAGLFCPGDVDCQPYSRGAVGGSVGVVGTTSPLCLRGFSGLAIFLGCRGARAGAAKVKITTKSPEHEFDHWLSSSSTSLIVLLGARQEEPDKDVWRRLKSIQSGLEQTAATECINMLLREHFRAKNSRRA